MIRKRRKNMFLILTYNKYGNYHSKNDLPATKQIYIQFKTFIWYKNNIKHRFDDLICHLVLAYDNKHISRYQMGYYNYGKNYIYTGYTHIDSRDTTKGFKYTKGICFELLKKELNYD